jgi:hypothetical protein
MKYLEIINKLSKELNIPEKVVDTAYKSFFSFMREVISNLPLKENLTEEEFNKLKTNFNLPALGKLHCTYERYLGIKEQKKYIKSLKNYEAQKD